MSTKRTLVWGLSNNRAGTEKVIDTYCSAMPDCHFDFLCYEYPAVYTRLIENPNNRVFTIPIKIKNPIKNAISIRQFSSQHKNEYETLWMNINDISNLDLLKLAANSLNIPQRIIHMHNAGVPNNPVTKVFSRINRGTLAEYATDYWACSKSAGDYLYGESKYQVIPNLVDDKRVAFSAKKRIETRAKYGIKEDELLIGSIGRLEEQKNYSQLLLIFSELLKSKSSSKLMIVGSGKQEDLLRRMVNDLEITEKVTFLKSTKDVQAYYSAFDVIAYPSLYEGLSLAILEAQYNGLPCILSSGISQECKICSSTTFIDVKATNDWVSAILSADRETNYPLPESNYFKLSNINNILSTYFNWA